MSNNKSFVLILLSSVAYYFAATLAGAITVKIVNATGNQDLAILQVPLGVIPGIGFYFLVNYFCRISHSSSIYLLPPKPPGTQYKRLAIGLVLSVFIVYFVAFLIKLTSKEPVDLRKMIMGTSFNTIIYMLSPAITEELMVRSGILHAFIIRGYKKLGVLVSSTLFGALHIFMLFYYKQDLTMENIIWLVNLSAVGVFLAFMYMRFGLVVAIFMHWFWNASFSNERMRLVEDNPISAITPLAIILLLEIVQRKILDKRDL